MNILFLMIPMALLLGFGFVSAFLYSLRRGQFDDLETPALRILKRDEDDCRAPLSRVQGDRNGK